MKHAFFAIICVAITSVVSQTIAADVSDPVVRATGTIEHRETAEVSPDLSGLRIKAFGPDAENPSKTIDYGSHVKKGDILAELDSTIQTTLVQAAQADLKRAIAGYELAKAQVVLAQRTFDQQKKRAQSANATADDADIAKAALDVAIAKVKSAEAAVDRAKADLKIAQINLDRCTIRSPIDGVVIDRRANVGQLTTTAPAPSLFLIAAAPDKLEIWANVDEANIARVAKGQSVRFTVDALPKKSFTGRVAQVRQNAQLTRNIVYFTVVIDVDDAKGLMPYLTANVAIYTDHADK